MKARSIIILLIGFLFTTCVNAQNQQKKKGIEQIKEQLKSEKVDSIKVALYGMLVEQTQFRNPQEAFKYTKKENELAVKIDFKKGIGSSFLHFADYYRTTGKLDSARFYYDKSIKLFEETDHLIGVIFVNHSVASFEKSLGNYDKALMAAKKNIDLYANRDTIRAIFGRAFNLIGAEYELIGDIHYEKGNYQIALSETLKALSFFKEKKDTIRKADALRQIGKVEFALNNIKSAITHTKEAFELYDAFNDQQYKSYAANDLGTYLLKTDDVDNALNFFETALEISQKLDLVDTKSGALNGLGNVYRKKKEFEKSRAYLKQSLALFKDLDYKNSLVITLNDLAKLELTNRKYKAALDYSVASISLSKQIGAKDNLKDAYYLNYQIWKKLNNTEEAIRSHEKFKAVNDSIFNITKSQQIEELRTIYETEKKEQQLAIQKNEIDILEQKAEINNLQRLLLGIGLTLSLLVLGFGYYGIKQKMKRNKLEKEKVDAELEFKKKELTTHALHLAKKNETLEGIKQQAKEFTTSENGHGFKQLIRSIDFDLQDDNNWENFARYFEEVHKDFNGNVKSKYPQVTPNELRLLALLKMNLSSKEIANILNISPEGIKKARYRLRKKLDLQTEDSLQDLVMGL